MTDPEHLDAVGLAEAIARGALAREEVIASALARLEMRDRLLRAMVDVVDAPRGTTSGPLGGVPIAVKDVLPWPGLSWSLGSRLFRGRLARGPSELGRRLEAAGAVCLGKTSMSELGLLASAETRAFGVTHNPWNLARSPGGSSAGSAVAVAAGLVPLAHGSDGGGSIRVPASACGVVGFVPSRGRLVTGSPGTGAWTDATRDGCLARTIRDVARFVTVTEDRASGLPPFDEALRLTRPLRVATWSRTMVGEEPDAEIAEALARSRAKLEELGHVVDEVEAPVVDAITAEAFLLVAGDAVAALVRAEDAARGEPVQEDALEPFTWDLVARAEEAGPSRIAAARAALASAGRTFAARFATHDVALTPTLPCAPWAVGHLSPLLGYQALAPRIARVMGYTPLVNVAGCPAISLPLETTTEGLPVGMHLVAAPGDDARLLALARQLEEAFAWRARVPPLFATAPA